MGHLEGGREWIRVTTQASGWSWGWGRVHTPTEVIVLHRVLRGTNDLVNSSMGIAERLLCVHGHC